MAGGDAYKEFDTNSIVSSATTQDATVKIGSFRFRKREFILGGVAFIALLFVLILAIVLAVEVGAKDSDDDDNSRARSNQQFLNGGPGISQINKTVDPEGRLCTSAACLKAANHEKSLLDETFEPCQDFYSFACGRYDDENPQTYLLEDVTPFSQVRMKNVRDLLDIINFPVTRDTRHSYERKLKHFLSSCNNHFDRMDLRGTPMVEKILNPWGPVYFLNNGFDPSTFDFHSQLLKTHADFWTPAFFTVDVVTNQEDWTKKVVELDYGGTGMRYQFYVNPNVADQAKLLYEDYMTIVLQLLSIDAQAEPNMTAISVFIQDVWTVESSMAAIIYRSPRLRRPHQEDQMMTLDDLTALSNNTLEFVHYMKNLFNEYPRMFTGSTKVAVRRAGYFHQLGALLATLEDTDEGRRQLSNYMIWTLINRYSHDLSWDYIHAKRKLNNYLYGQKDDSSGAYYCFTETERSMSDAMDAMFIKNFVKEGNKREADRVLASVRREMLTSLEKLPWMSETDRNTAITKIRGSLYKIGYADYMVHEDYMDNMYSMVNINETDFFGNKLNLNKAARAMYNKRISNPGARTHWAYHIFDPAVEYWNPWHELIATAAIFQNPLFYQDAPAYLKYGGVGSLIAKHLIHAVDEYGNSFRLDGTHFGDWWAQVTTDRYREIRQCAQDAQKGTNLGSFVDPYNQQTVQLNVSRYSFDYAPELLSDSSGLRLAYKAYKSWEESMGREKMPPGFSKRNPDQMFFIAYAQSSCQNTPEVIRAIQLLNRNQYPSKAKVNLAVSQVPEFAKAFNCMPGTPMHPPKTCTLF